MNSGLWWRGGGVLPESKVRVWLGGGQHSSLLAIYSHAVCSRNKMFNCCAMLQAMARIQWNWKDVKTERGVLFTNVYSWILMRTWSSWRSKTDYWSRMDSLIGKVNPLRLKEVWGSNTGRFSHSAAHDKRLSGLWVARPRLSRDAVGYPPCLWFKPFPLHGLLIALWL